MMAAVQASGVEAVKESLPPGAVVCVFLFLAVSLVHGDAAVPLFVLWQGLLEGVDDVEPDASSYLVGVTAGGSMVCGVVMMLVMGRGLLP